MSNNILAENKLYAIQRTSPTGRVTYERSSSGNRFWKLRSAADAALRKLVVAYPNSRFELMVYTPISSDHLHQCVSALQLLLTYYVATEDTLRCQNEHTELIDNVDEMYAQMESLLDELTR